MTPEQQKLREAVIAAIKAKGMYVKPRTVADAAIAVVLNEAAKVAARYVIDKKELHPDIPFDHISQDYKNAIHTGAQYIAFAIRDLSPTTSHSSESDPQSD